MCITEIRGYLLGYDLSGYYGNSSGRIPRREIFVLELRDAEGRSGWGEAAFGPSAASALAEDVLAPVLLGRAASDRAGLWRAMLATRGYDRRGAAMMAISAADMALHDLAARQAGQSVAALLGGRLRDRLPAYASGPYLGPLDAPYAGLVATAETLVARGYRALKPRLGIGVAEDIAAMTALRAALGPEIELMADANGRYSPAAALALAEGLAPLRLAFLEEPVDIADVAGIARVAAQAGLPIATGEGTADLSGMTELLDRAPIAAFQPDLGVCGGFTGFEQAMVLAEARGVACMPHVWGGAIGFAASLQAACRVPETRSLGRPYPFIECDTAENPLLHLFGAVAPDADGYVAVPDRPGIGLDVDPEAFAPFCRSTWTRKGQLQ